MSQKRNQFLSEPIFDIFLKKPLCLGSALLAQTGEGFLLTFVEAQSPRLCWASGSRDQTQHTHVLEVWRRRPVPSPPSSTACNHSSRPAPPLGGMGRGAGGRGKPRPRPPWATFTIKTFKGTKDSPHTHTHSHTHTHITHTHTHTRTRTRTRTHTHTPPLGACSASSRPAPPFGGRGGGGGAGARRGKPRPRPLWVTFTIKTLKGTKEK